MYAHNTILIANSEENSQKHHQCEDTVVMETNCK